MKSSQYHVIGVMSGTSLDGIDLCEITFKKDGIWQFEINASSTKKYPDKWREKLQNSILLSSSELEALDVDYTHYLAKQILHFIDEHHLNNIDFISSHGHTVLHEPEKGITKQIGNREALASLTGCKVVCDFRVQDVALKGQGAPLVPIGDKLLFGNYDYCLNLGGFANISFEDSENRIAFDICPVNVVLNHYANQLQQEYDNDGKLAEGGIFNGPLFNALNSLDFYRRTYPKSLGMEWVNEQIIPLLESFELPPEDILRTFVEHIAEQISNILDQRPKAKVLVTGGGAFNTFLLERMKACSKNEFKIPDGAIVDFKEALIFGLLGVLKLRDEVNCLSSVTGAIRDHSSGKIFLP